MQYIILAQEEFRKIYFILIIFIDKTIFIFEQMFLNIGLRYVRII